MKLFTDPNLKQAGYQLVETVIGSAIIIGVGMASYAMYGARFKLQGQMEALRELETYHKALSRNLQLTANCNATFSTWADNNTVPQGEIHQIWFCGSECTEDKLASEVVREATPRITESSANPTDGSQWISNKMNWEVTDLEVTNPATRTGNIDLKIIYTLKPGGKMVQKLIPLSLSFTKTPPYRFLTCVSDKKASTLNRELCDAMGAQATSGKMVEWNDTTKRCDLITAPMPLNCDNDTNRMLRGIDSTGATTCRSITEKVDTTDLFDATDADCHVPRVPQVFINPEGKVQVRCI